ncbi:MAG: amino acid adenylation domain-containing protein [Longimicrobiaceae bacterium]
MATYPAFPSDTHVQESYRLSPLQHGMLIQTLLAPASGVNIEQVVCRLNEPVDSVSLEKAWSEVVQRHAILRTRFRWADVAEPLQEVLHDVRLAIACCDLAGIAPSGHDGWLDAYLKADRARGFDLSKAPAMRLALFKLSSEEHVLVWTFHHILLGGGSIAAVFREVFALYDAAQDGTEVDLPAPRPFRDHIAWLLGRDPATDEAYWTAYLLGIDAPAPLLGSRNAPRGPELELGFDEREIQLSPGADAMLREFKRKRGVNVNTLLQGVWAVLLGRYTGRDEVVFGLVRGGRATGVKGAEGMVGLLINTVPVRVPLPADMCASEWLMQIAAGNATLRSHEHAALQDIARWSGLPKNTPLFDTIFSYQTESFRQAFRAMGGRWCGRSIRIVQHAGYPLSVAASGVAPLQVRLGYDAKLWDSEAVDRMLGHLERVLEQVTSNADTRLSELELLGEAEHRQVLVAWNQTKCASPLTHVHTLITEQARRTPDAVALLHGGSTLTYAALDRRATVLARRLGALGVGPEVLVGLCVERTPELLVGVLGIWKAGGAYVPLDPSYPAERLDWIIADAGVPVIVTTESAAGALPEHGAAVVRVDQLPDEAPDETPEEPTCAESLAYVIYTSGSTGYPKGVLVQHGSLANLLAATREVFGVRAGDVMPPLASYAFDIWLFETLLPLTSGAAVRLVGRELVTDIPSLLVEVSDATLLHAVPAFMREIVQVGRAARLLGRLRRVFVGGDLVSADLLAEMRATLPAAEIHVLYGPTEGTILASARAVPTEMGVEGHRIGRPLGNVRLYICDPQGSAQPVGVPGELRMGGKGVARGYLGRPELTAEQFVPDPFSGESGARLYRTGDRVRWLATGELEFLGRTDAQVKVRGYRIEPGEIEARLLEHESVREAVVVAREGDAGDKWLVAYWVGEREVGVDRLRAHLQERLPEYMVPAAYVRLEVLPLTLNGKLDRRALPPPEGDAYARRGYETPLGAVEVTLAEIWAEVLRVERVGRWDHYFELGGHSLLAIRLIERMRRVGLYTDVRALFTAPVLAELALAVSWESREVEVPANGIQEGCESILPEMLPLVELRQEEIDRIVAGVPGGVGNVQDIYPLAPLQEGILFHHMMSQVGDPYLLSNLTTFDTRTRLEQYLAAFQGVIDRHDILRTAMAWEGLREPVQVVWRRTRLSVEEVELDAGEGDVAGQLWKRCDPRHHRMDLRRAPLLRACIAEDRATGRWLLLLQLHHLTSDHESLEVLQEEISTHLLSRESELPPPLPFRNYVAQARLGVSRQEHESFFRELLGDVEETTAPYGLLDVWGEGRGVEEGRLEVEADLTARLRGRARALGVSAASLFHLAWAQVLARLTGREDVVFGTLLFGRMQGGAGSDRVMGPFINTLPVRIRVGADAVEASVRQTHGLLAELLRREHASLALAQRCSGVAAPVPLFTSLLNYRYSGKAGRSHEERQARVGIALVRMEVRTNYPVIMAVEDRGEEFSLAVQVAAPAEAVRVCRMMHTALERLLEALEVSPGRAIGSIDVLPETERRQVVEEWNATDSPFSDGACLHELVEARARHAPGTVALAHGARTLTYGEMDRAVEHLARNLRAHGVAPETRVALFLESAPEAVIALLAVLRAGGAYVPLDTGSPPERLAFLLEDSGARLVLTRSALAGRHLAAAAEVVYLDDEGTSLSPVPSSLPECEPAPVGATADNLAYVIYTSGSTGRPKGVLVPHRGVCNSAEAYVRVYGIGPGSRVLLFAPLHFDASVLDVFTALCSGATLVLASREELTPGEGLAELLRRERVTHLKITPSALAVTPHAGLPELEVVMVGGETCSAELLARWAPGRRFYNGYGATEHSVRCTAELCGDATRSPPVGCPIANARLYVLDARLEPAPPRVPGEVYMAGLPVTRGYLGRPDLTAERFVPDPYTGVPGARMYRSGDRGRWLPEGTLEFVGRSDFQLKVRGFRIEPGEVEAALLEHPSLVDAVVVARGSAVEERYLAAYVVAREGAEAPGAAELRELLRERLPEHMVPAAYVRLERLPLTSNGKVDRGALPGPEGDAYARRGYEAPLGEVEETLAAIWAEVLGVERVGRWEHFFELGGHSLLAMQVVSRVRQRLGVEVPLGEVFRLSVMAEYARAVTMAARADLPRIEAVDRTGPLPLSFAQQRLWFLEQLGGLGSAYHMPWRLRLQGALDVDALRGALERIVARHEALRTTFPLVEGQPVQRIVPVEESRFHFVEHDLYGTAESVEELRRLLREEWSTPFDLERGPLIRGCLIRLGMDEHVLGVTMHHIVSDGWSMGMWARELSVLYAAFHSGEADPLPALAVQYGDYAVWQRRWVEGEVLRAQADYWKATLAGAPELLELPTDRARQALQDHAGASLGVELREELTAGLKGLSQRQGTTLFMTLLAGWAVVLSRLSGQEDVVIGTPTANRGQAEIEELIGFFVNTLALRLDLSGSLTVGELLRRVRERTLEAQHHQDIPFEQVVELVQPVRSLAHSPLCQVTFAWQNAPWGELTLPGLTVAGMGRAGQEGNVKFDLSLTLGESKGRIVGSVHYATSLYERATVERYVGYLRRVLEAMAADEHQAVGRLSLLPEAERRHLLETCGTPALDHPRTCLHELFSQQAGRTPDLVALVHGERTLGYAEVDRRSSQIAHLLRRRGVGPEARVGLCLERGPEQVLAVLGILKAGGAYVPLDPAYPSERIAYTLDDSGASVLITQSSLLNVLPRYSGQVLCLDWEPNGAADQAQPLTPELGGDVGNAAYVIYTSGSTGRPKGVVVEHSSFTSTLLSTRDTFGLGAGEVFPVLASYAFDIWAFEVFAPLLAGGRVHLLEQEVVQDVERLSRELAVVTALHAVPALMREVVLHVQSGPGTLPGMRHVFIGGDVIAPELLEAVQAAFPAAQVWAMYGPTEGTIISSGTPLRPGVSYDWQMVGRALPGVGMYVCGAGGDLLPEGVPGELLLGGGGITRGYLGQGERTAERYIPDPFSGGAGARLYRTGDRVRRRGDGELEFLGRVDHQVKVRGYRIELGEIERGLQEHEEVCEAVVVAREEGPGDVRLAAYYVSEVAIGVDELRGHLLRRLPEPMVPAAYVRLERLPLTPTGKVDRGVLPAPEEDAYARRGYEAPLGEVEEMLAAIWVEVLKVERVGRWDHFFELGGHSLLAITLIERMRRVGLYVEVRALFTTPVLAELVREVKVEPVEVQVPPNLIPNLNDPGRNPNVVELYV